MSNLAQVIWLTTQILLYVLVIQQQRIIYKQKDVIDAQESLMRDLVYEALKGCESDA